MLLKMVLDSHKLVKRILDLKEEIEQMVHGRIVLLSLPIHRNDNLKANKILSDVREKIISLKLDTINNLTGRLPAILVVQLKI